MFNHRIITYKQFKFSVSNQSIINAKIIATIHRSTSLSNKTYTKLERVGTRPYLMFS